MMYDKPDHRIFGYLGTDESFWIYGDTSKPAILIIPGFTGTASSLFEFAYLLKEDFLVILPDLPGWGKSERLSGNNNLDSYTEYLSSLTEGLSLPKINVLGHCMGSTLSINFALKNPNLVEHLFLVSTPYLQHTLAGEIFVHLSEFANKSQPIVARMFYLWRNRPVGILASLAVLKFRTMNKKIKVIKQTLIRRRDENEKVMEENWYSLVHFNYSSSSKLKAKTHLIFGDRDLLLPKSQAHSLHNLVPGSSLDFISQAGHLPPMETPGSLAHLIRDYMIKAR